MPETASVLTGTWPLRTHANRFFGTVKADGQHPRVAGIVCADGDVVALSLVGYDTSVSAVLSTLWLHEAVPFLVGDDVSWKGPRLLRRRFDAYRQFSTQLPGTREVHAIALPASVHIAEGILHPPDLPNPKEELDDCGDTPTAGTRRPGRPIELPVVDRTRFVLGNWDEATPHVRSFLGQLYGLRVLFLHRDDDHPEWSIIWANELWLRGLSRKLIEPLPFALGLRGWELSGNLESWGRLIGEGVRAGWLPWQGTIAGPPPLAVDNRLLLVS